MTRADSGIRPTTSDSSGAGSAEKRRSAADGDTNGMLAAAAGNEQQEETSSEEDDEYYAATSPDEDVAVGEPREDEEGPDLFGDAPQAQKEHAEENAADESNDEEEVPVRRPRNPADPTPEEREVHCAKGHVPYRSWCKICVEARGREDPHSEQPRMELELDCRKFPWTTPRWAMATTS